MKAIQRLITEHIDIWTGADTGKRPGRGRASSNAGSVYGVKKLRELILELAVRGKLVPQDANDEPVSELLKRIQAEKAKLVAEGKIKKEKPFAPISDDEKPFELPNGWEWVKLTDVGYTQTGTTPSKSEVNAFGSDVPFVKPGDIYPNYVDYENEGLSFSGAKNGRVAPAGSLLMVCIGTIGKCNIIEKDCSFNQQINSITPFLLDSRYLLIAGRANSFQSECWSNSSSTTLPILNKGKWEQICLPLPPLAEQHRIVAKVDELMALCDQLEAQHSNTAGAHEKLVSHLLGTLTQSQSADDFSANWQRIAAHFDTLFTTETSIDALKQTLLQLAVMGKLVPQDANDEPASELLKRIQAEKAKLMAEGKLKKEKPLALINEVEKPFEVPNGWELCRWNSIAMKIGDIDHKMPETVSDGIPYVSPRDFYPNNVIDFSNAKQVSKKDYTRLATKIKPDFGDLIYPRYGTIGETRLVEVQQEFLASYSCAVIKTMNSFINPKYQYIFSISNYCKQQAKAAENKTTQANVGIANIQLYVVPLPPLTEQHRIVAKVDELMTLCDQLKTRIQQANQQQQAIADTLVAQAVA